MSRAVTGSHDLQPQAFDLYPFVWRPGLAMQGKKGRRYVEGYVFGAAVGVVCSKQSR
jgi:hypothetical protein